MGDHKTMSSDKEITAKVKIKQEPIDFVDEFSNSDLVEELEVKIEVQLEKLPEEENHQGDNLLGLENLVRVEIQGEDIKPSGDDNAEMGDLRPNNSSYKVQQNSIAEAEYPSTSSSMIIRPINNDTAVEAESPCTSSTILIRGVCAKCKRSCTTVCHLKNRSGPHYCIDCRRLFETRSENHLKSNPSRKMAVLENGVTSPPSSAQNAITQQQQALYKCQKCALEFSQFEVFAKHERLTHWKDEGSVCGKVCLKPCTSASTIIRPNKQKAIAQSPGTDESASTIIRPKRRDKNAIKAHKSTSSSAIIRPVCAKCMNCLRLFETKALFENHVESNPSCKNVMTQLQQLLQLHKCQKCGLEFPQLSSLAEHVRLSHVEDSCICKHCGKGCLKPWFLKIHLMRIHNEGETTLYTCKTCKKVFKTETGLKQHNCCKCLYCGKVFRQRKDLGEHTISAHGAEGERSSFQCNQCDKKYLHRRTLRTHIGMCHGKERQSSRYYECQECGKKFTYQHTLKIHLRHVHCITSPYDSS